jgi:hypothetical protein
MRRLLAVTILCTGLMGLAFTAVPNPVPGHEERRKGLEISVTACSPSPCTPDQPVKFGETIPNQTPTIAITVTSEFDCAGQLALTALGAPGFPPEVGVLTSPGLFTIGPDVVPPYGNGNSATTLPITLGVLPNGTNAFKISASCNGAAERHFAFAEFEFSTN